MSARVSILVKLFTPDARVERKVRDGLVNNTRLVRKDTRNRTVADITITEERTRTVTSAEGGGTRTR